MIAATLCLAMPLPPGFVTRKRPASSTPFAEESPMLLLCSLVVIGIAVYAIVRRVDVRLTLFLAALTLSTLTSAFTVLETHDPRDLLNGPMAIVRVFLTTLAN